MTPKLVLLKGGKRDGGGGDDKKKRKKMRRPHPLNELLWYVISRICFPVNRADSVETVAARMTSKSEIVLGRKVFVTTAMANYCLYDARRRRFGYGWMPLHVQKGSEGEYCGFVPVLVDTDDDDFENYLLDAADITYICAGLKSSLHTTASMLRNDADGIVFAVGLLDALKKDSKVLREFASELRAVAKKAEAAADEADVL